MDHEQGFDLGASLAEQRAVCRQDSEGSFTVSAERALSKLARFALPGDFDWVLKIVQAVNAWKAPELIVRQTRVATSFTFVPQKMSGLDEEIVQCLQSGSLNNASPVHLLSMALRSLVDQAQLSFALAIRHHGELGKPIFAGSDTSKMSPKTREQWTKLEREGVRLTVSHFRGDESLTGRFIPTLSGLPRRDIEISQILDQRAYLSGTSIRLDGRWVTDLAKNPIWGHSKWFRPLRIATWEKDGYRYKHADLPVLAKSKELQVHPPPVDFNDPWYYITTVEWVSLRKTARGAFALRPQVGAHSVVWLRFGVEVEKRTIYNTEEYTRLLFVLPTVDLRTDLSGLAVQIDEEEEKRVADLARNLVSDLNQAARNAKEWTKDLGAGTVGLEAGLSAEKRRVDDEDLSAGHSLYTVSIAPELGKYRLPIGKFIRNLETIVEPPDVRRRTLDEWTAKVKGELHGIADDFRRRLERNIFAKDLL